VFSIVNFRTSQQPLEVKRLWDTTREPNLLRNTARGRYNGSFTPSGKQKRVNVQTNVWRAAKIRQFPKTVRTLWSRVPSSNRVKTAEKTVLLAIWARREIQGIRVAQAVAISEGEGPDAVDANDF
jgi:hypothetical protein